MRPRSPMPTLITGLGAMAWGNVSDGWFEGVPWRGLSRGHAPARGRKTRSVVGDPPNATVGARVTRLGELVRSLPLDSTCLTSKEAAPVAGLGVRCERPPKPHGLGPGQPHPDGIETVGGHGRPSTARPVTRIDPVSSTIVRSPRSRASVTSASESSSSTVATAVRTASNPTSKHSSRVVRP